MEQLELIKREKPYRGRLEDWSFAPRQTITAFVFDEPVYKFGEGAFIVTSSIVKLDRKNGTVETRNSIYKLGKEFITKSEGG